MVRELEVIGVLRKNGVEGLVAEAAVKRDAKWNLRAVVFVQGKKEPAHSGRRRGSPNAVRYGIALENKEASNDLDDV